MPRKSLGQHFLVSEAHVRRIVDRAEGLAGVLEIGPGPATLTPGLCEAVGQVVAVDVDARTVPILAEAAPCAEVLIADVLALDVRALLARLPSPRGIVSNMPYGITGPLLEVVFECADLVQKAVLMMQLEVAERVLARPGTSARGALSVVAQAWFETELVARVPAGAFSPPPKVESAVLELRPRADRPSDGFRELVRQGFRQPRKTLAGNLGWPTEQAEIRLAEAGLPPKVRPHQLTGEQWQKLARHWPTV